MDSIGCEDGVEGPRIGEDLEESTAGSLISDLVEGKSIVGRMDFMPVAKKAPTATAHHDDGPQAEGSEGMLVAGETHAAGNFNGEDSKADHRMNKGFDTVRKGMKTTGVITIEMNEDDDIDMESWVMLEQPEELIRDMKFFNPPSEMERTRKECNDLLKNTNTHTNTSAKVQGPTAQTRKISGLLDRLQSGILRLRGNLDKAGHINTDIPAGHQPSRLLPLKYNLTREVNIIRPGTGNGNKGDTFEHVAKPSEEAAESGWSEGVFQQAFSVLSWGFMVARCLFPGDGWVPGFVDRLQGDMGVATNWSASSSYLEGGDGPSGT
ncbi:hypothetical protein BDZ91DRAFT_334678 [Kalaharituber pfeilii]|nr:hypothetical protein BDZ91DRAFT_334678 [Kalaharituber pfeilii]